MSLVCDENLHVSSYFVELFVDDVAIDKKLRISQLKHTHTHTHFDSTKVSPLKNRMTIGGGLSYTI